MTNCKCHDQQQVSQLTAGVTTNSRGHDQHQGSEPTTEITNNSRGHILQHGSQLTARGPQLNSSVTTNNRDHNLKQGSQPTAEVMTNSKCHGQQQVLQPTAGSQPTYICCNIHTAGGNKLQEGLQPTERKQPIAEFTTKSRVYNQRPGLQPLAGAKLPTGDTNDRRGSQATKGVTNNRRTQLK
jgi:hypothetical protein